MAIEIEKKYRLDEERSAIVETDLKAFGAAYLGEVFEENTLFGNDDLAARNAVLRIRKTAIDAKLTFKQRLQSVSDAKRQLEFESAVEDPEAVRAIVEVLGFSPVVIYEKRRRTYEFRSVEVVLDELPFGRYMEIEGALTSIAEAEMLLEIEDLEVEEETYPRLARVHGRQVGEIVEARF